VDPQDDPETRIRELERPLSEAAGWSESGTVTYGAAPRRGASGRGWALVLGVVVLGSVAIAAGAAFFALRNTGGGATARIPSAATSVLNSRPSSTTSSAVAPANQAVQTLYRLLPRGYDAHQCSPITSPNRQALATIECGHAANPHGPAYSAFSLYPTTQALADAFQNGVDEDSVTPCPNGDQSPATWSTDAAPKVPAGSVVCGKYGDQSDLIWTTNRDLVLTDIQGPNLNALYQFWQHL
jgi:hypothetical protein